MASGLMITEPVVPVVRHFVASRVNDVDSDAVTHHHRRVSNLLRLVFWKIKLNIAAFIEAGYELHVGHPLFCFISQCIRGIFW